MKQGTYKNYQRGRRQYTIDTDFVNGMMFTNGAVDEGYVKSLVNYDIQEDGKALIPRPGLRVSELILPNVALENDVTDRTYHTDENISIMAAKDCIENGKTYKQFILGKPAIGSEEGYLWVCTSNNAEYTVSNEGSSSDDTVIVDDFSVNVSLGNATYQGTPCKYFLADMPKIHDLVIAPDNKIASLIGTFAFGNSFYFFHPVNGLSYTSFNEVEGKYTVKTVQPKQISPSEAVTFGYNMLSGDDAYAFINESLEGIIQLTGILPYSVKEENTLLMTPKQNEDIYLRCYFKGQIGKSYKFMWEWRNVGDEDWNVLQSLDKSPTYTLVQLNDGVVGLDTGSEVLDKLQISFKAPTTDILVRVQAYATSDLQTVEKAMTVGFDFSLEAYGMTSNVKQETYDLKTATGIECWQNRLVVWGIPKDPTVLFISDMNDPTYFPYPNNISIYDEPIISVKAFLDSLLVFTTSAIYQVTLNSDGISWTSTIVQSNLNLEPWDRHLIQVVRNMVFFKSGNYYFMMVPKAQSTTGELALAPVSSSIVEFFNHFEYNVTSILQDTFNYQSELNFINYFNYLDYEDVHNVYVYRYSDENSDKEGYLHFDMLYNTVSRSWRIHTYEAPHYLYPYKQDATKRGMLASTSLMSTVLEDGDVSTVTTTKQPIRDAVNTTNILYLSNEYVDFLELQTVYVDVKDALGVTYISETFGLTRLVTNPHQIQFYNDSSSYYLTYDLVSTGDEGKLTLRSTLDNLQYGSTVTVYDATRTSIVWGPQEVENKLYTVYEYDLSDNCLQNGTTIIVSGKTYVLKESGSNYVPVDDDAFVIKVNENRVYFKTQQFSTPVLLILNVTGDVEQLLSTGRCIQIYTPDVLNVQDLYVPAGTVLTYQLDLEQGYQGYNMDYLVEALAEKFASVSEKFMFKNWQYLDTGYRDNSLELNKRYREVQFQLNNIDGVNLEFGLEFQIDGQSRLSDYVYEVEHVIDENDPDYGLIYVQSTPYMNLPLEYIGTANSTDLGPGSNAWILNQSLFPDLSLWKVRAPVSGKGYAPRIRLVSRNTSRFELMSISWVYRLLYAR